MSSDFCSFREEMQFIKIEVTHLRMAHFYRVVHLATRLKILRLFPCQIKSERCFPPESQVPWWRELCGVQEEWNNVMKKYKTKTVPVTIVAVVTFCCLFVVVTNCYREQVETRSRFSRKTGGSSGESLWRHSFGNYTGYPARAVIGKLQGSTFLTNTQHKNSKPTWYVFSSDEHEWDREEYH